MRDLWIDGGKIVAAPADPAVRPARVLDARGLVVMPGGIDMHCHIAGPKTNAARRLRPEESRTAEPVLRTARTHSGTMGSVPSTFATGYRYAGLGYTTAFDAAITPLAARHAHAELADTPCIDKGFYVLVGNNHYLLDAIGQQRARAGRSVSRLAAGGHQGLCPQAGQSGRRRGLEAGAARCTRSTTACRGFNVTPREIIHARRPGRQPAEAAALGPRSHGKSGHARQLDDHAGNDANGRAVRRTSDAHSIPQLWRHRTNGAFVRPWRRWPNMSTSIRD